MNKTEFIKLLAKNMDTSATEADKALKKVFETIAQAVSQEDILAFVGFGTFKTTISKAKKVKTPRGTMVDIPEKRIVRFSPGSELKAKADTKK
ncbi:HU family DNA-binding protein [Candidatus Bandiella euplotis]|uniref:HU family DNA-binding protein n=1 Tax=Candidatus Bandiella euplotis TaxID=1664265 RepID=A0ABZ0UMW4_9RICK|nr:HU family DNA-binding protein [Candidatus Bandiella woodruffii]WPX97476.1 HU family DNA-binding protein [Candidatus Bandiella woodruffii]